MGLFVNTKCKKRELLRFCWDVSQVVGAVNSEHRGSASASAIAKGPGYRRQRRGRAGELCRDVEDGAVVGE